MPSRHSTECITIDPSAPDAAIIRRAAGILVRGGLVAFPTETVYGLGANAFDAQAVRQIFAAKGRPANDPLIVHIRSIVDLPLLAAEIPPMVRELAAAFWPGPLTLLLPRRATLPEEVTSGLGSIAVRVPAHPVALALLEESGVPIAAPSANRFGHTSPTLARHVEDDLGGKVDMILDAGQTGLGVESTVLDPLQSPPVILRPGGTPREEIERVVGAVRLAGAGERPSASPGRLARHYAPDARLLLARSDDPGGIAREMEQLAADYGRRGEKVGILAADEVASRLDPELRGQAAVEPLGAWGDARAAAGRLFAALRDLEAAGAQVILAHRLPPGGLGDAINDRLERAAHDKHAGM